MDVARLETLWAYAMGGKKAADEGAVLRAMDMYTGGLDAAPVTPELRAAVEAGVKEVMGKVGSGAKPQAVLDAILAAGPSGSALAQALAAVDAAKKKVGSEGLATLLGDDLDDDEDDEDADAGEGDEDEDEEDEEDDDDEGEGGDDDGEEEEEEEGAAAATPAAGSSSGAAAAPAASAAPASSSSAAGGADASERKSKKKHKKAKRAKEEGMKVLMRGMLKVAEGALSWAGSWAESVEAFDAGNKSKFKYVYSGSKDVSKAQEGDQIVRPVSGQYSGSFLVKDATAPDGFVRVDEASVRIDFDESGKPGVWKVTGKGSNVHGEFALEGELDGASRRMALVKSYKARPRRDDDDDDDDDEILDDEVDESELADLRAEAAAAGLEAPSSAKRARGRGA